MRSESEELVSSIESRNGGLPRSLLSTEFVLLGHPQVRLCGWFMLQAGCRWRAWPPSIKLLPAHPENTTALCDLGYRKGPDVDAIGMPTITPAPPAWLLREVHGHSLHHSAVRPDRSSEIQTPMGCRR